jgi:PKD repeat protein
VPFSGADSIETNDGNQSNLTFEWHFGDGSPLATGMLVNHTYAAAGVYEVDLNVYNAFGQSAQKRVTITVRAEGSTNTFLGLAALIVGALFAVAVVWPVSRRRARDSAKDDTQPGRRKVKEDAPRRSSPPRTARVADSTGEDHEREAVDELANELENGGSGRP